jgi:hypothetical protein
MSPRGSSALAGSSSTNRGSAPYPRRSSGQPKSSRQQFSACGACRMRRYTSLLSRRHRPPPIFFFFSRVRCDLKDLPFSSAGPHPTCSNCKERGLKCVYVSSPTVGPQTPNGFSCPSDEFADVKAVKLLRRGRRLQQVECVPTLLHQPFLNQPLHP